MIGVISMYERFIKFDDIMNIIRSNHIGHWAPNHAAIKKAYDYAFQKHAGQNRDAGEPYIMHPLRVAKIVAEWGFESDVVIAALLHDVAEDCNTSIFDIQNIFGSEIAQMVDTVTKLKKDLNELEGLTKEEIKALSNAKLQAYMSDKALYIKLADRIDNLSTIDCYPKEKQIKKAVDTREILLPMAVQMGAYKIIDILEELCFKIEHETQYNIIINNIKKYNLANIRSCNKTISIFEDAFLKSSSFKQHPAFPSELKPYKNFISGFFSNERSKISIFRQIAHEAENLNKDFDNLLDKHHLAFYDLTIVFDNSLQEASEGLTPYDIFYKYYENYLINCDICILNYSQTTYKDCSYFLLCDEMKNRYRLFIRTEDTYLRYQLGNIIDSDIHITFKDVNEVDPRDTYKPKIKVFKRNGEACYIDAGATALDFAFLIHSDLGIHFEYALINHEHAHQGMHYILNDGDEIEVVASTNITPKITWFKHAKTSRAAKKLVEYFS